MRTQLAGKSRWAVTQPAKAEEISAMAGGAKGTHCAQAEQRTVSVFVAVEVDVVGGEDKEDPSASQRVD
jgi:hypothetical protein